MRQERREADKMATMRKRGNWLAEYLKRYKQNVRKTASVSGGTFKFENMRPHRTKGKCSAYTYVVPSPTFTKKTLWECLKVSNEFYQMGNKYRRQKWTLNLKAFAISIFRIT
jgi:hypothetical protein